MRHVLPTFVVLPGLLLAALALPAAGSPRIDYLLYCGGCHLENGTGDPPEVPDLTADVPSLVRAEGGRAYLAQVPGSAQAPLEDDRLADVLNYIVREFNPDVEDFVPFTREEIGSYRDTTLLDPLAARKRILGP